MAGNVFNVKGALASNKAVRPGFWEGETRGFSAAPAPAAAAGEVYVSVLSESISDAEANALFSSIDAILGQSQSDEETDFTPWRMPDIDAAPSAPSVAVSMSSSADARAARQSAVRAARERALVLAEDAKAVEQTRTYRKRARDIAKACHTASKQRPTEAQSTAAAASSSSARTEPGALRAEVIAGQMSGVYGAASAVLLPLLALSNKELAAIERPSGTYALSIETIFEKGLTPVCDIVYGPGLRVDLMTAFQKKEGRTQIRDFFETETPGTQCTKVIGPYTQNTPCWICSTKVLNPDKKDAELPLKGHPECEHRLAVILALFLTGLYDRRAAMSYAYTALLRYEYEWSHNRCNQIKREIPFITYTISGRGEKTISFSPDKTNIKNILTTILTKDYGQSYKPTHEQIAKDIGTDVPDAPKDLKVWPEWQTEKVCASLEALLGKLNARALSPSHLVNRIVAGFLDRAILLAPALVAKRLTERGTGPPHLTARQLDALTQQLNKPRGGKRKTFRTGRKRKTLRKRMAGGETADIAYDAMAYLAITLTKSMLLQDMLGNRVRAARDIADYSGIPGLVDTYIETTEKVAFDVLEIALKMDPTTPLELETSIRETILEQYPSDKYPGVHASSAGWTSPSTTGKRSAVDEVNARPAKMSAPAAAPAAIPTGTEEGEAAMESDTTPEAGPGSSLPPSFPPGTLPSTLQNESADGTMSGDASQLSIVPGSPPRTALGSPSGTPPPRPTGFASEFGSIVSPPAKPPTNRGGGFKFTLGTRPDWL